MSPVCPLLESFLLFINTWTLQLAELACYWVRHSNREFPVPMRLSERKVVSVILQNEAASTQSSSNYCAFISPGYLKR
ncbi:hypothetical protein EDD85DRAFT_855701 [Armillaria nabsnona]|nr:hypothetical protein EDD85DRAFT_855701 [Armillaria nabsnona]